MSKNKTEIRAFTRQIAEEGRVEYSIDQWYEAEKVLRLGENIGVVKHELSNDKQTFGTRGVMYEKMWAVYQGHNNNTSGYLNDWVDRATDPESKPELGEFCATPEHMFKIYANSIKTHYHYGNRHGTKASYLYCVRGHNEATQVIAKLARAAKIVIACRKAYPFVNWITCSSKPNSRSNKRYAAAREKWDNNQWSGVAYYKRNQQIPVGGVNDFAERWFEFSESFLGNWDKLQNGHNITRSEDQLAKYEKLVEEFKQKMEKKEKNWDNEEWVAQFIAKAKKEDLKYIEQELSRNQRYAEQAQAHIDMMKKEGIVSEEQFLKYSFAPSDLELTTEIDLPELEKEEVAA